MRKNPLHQVTFVLSLVFSVVYLGLGIVLIAGIILIPWLELWLQIAFGIGLILYAFSRFYRAYLVYKEERENV